jgi:stage II sporulation protein AB (anti-sigma F factor)
MDYTNEMLLEIESQSRNESFARMVVAGFVAQLDPTIEEIADIKTAVSEAVTNSIIHGYNNGAGKVNISCRICNHEVFIIVTDTGKGIEDIEKAMEPLYTTRPELERSGMGFSFMEAFMDDLVVESKLGEGTTVKMKKLIH